MPDATAPTRLRLPEGIAILGHGSRLPMGLKSLSAADETPAHSR